jgi:hypothetical protein
MGFKIEWISIAGPEGKTPLNEFIANCKGQIVDNLILGTDVGVIYKGGGKASSGTTTRKPKKTGLRKSRKRTK